MNIEILLMVLEESLEMTENIIIGKLMGTDRVGKESK